MVLHPARGGAEPGEAEGSRRPDRGRDASTEPSRAAGPRSFAILPGARRSDPTTPRSGWSTCCCSRSKGRRTCSPRWGDGSASYGAHETGSAASLSSSRVTSEPSGRITYSESPEKITSPDRLLSCCAGVASRSLANAIHRPSGDQTGKRSRPSQSVSLTDVRSVRVHHEHILGEVALALGEHDPAPVRRPRRLVLPRLVVGQLLRGPSRRGGPCTGRTAFVRAGSQAPGVAGRRVTRRPTSRVPRAPRISSLRRHR